jgi:hypothetical protein
MDRWMDDDSQYDVPVEHGVQPGSMSKDTKYTMRWNYPGAYAKISNLEKSFPSFSGTC